MLKINCRLILSVSLKILIFYQESPKPRIFKSNLEWGSIFSVCKKLSTIYSRALLMLKVQNSMNEYQILVSKPNFLQFDLREKF